jgi:hypothetical protein
MGTLDSTEFLSGFQPKNPMIVEGGFHILPASYRFGFQTVPFDFHQVLPVCIPAGANR